MTAATMKKKPTTGLHWIGSAALSACLDAVLPEAGAKCAVILVRAARIFGHLHALATQAPLVLGLVVWLGLIPLFQVAHFVFADHDHRFCEHHHRIEDIPRREPSQRWTLDKIVEGQNAWSTRGREAMLLHAPCAILNHTPLRESLLIAGGPCAIVRSDQNRVLITSTQEIVRARPLLLTAPKTSPPFAAV